VAFQSRRRRKRHKNALAPIEEHVLDTYEGKTTVFKVAGDKGISEMKLKQQQLLQ